MKPFLGMVPFFERFPEVAWRETRVVMLPEPQSGVPAGSYGFIELYCSDPKCDCRRVLLLVRPEHAPQEVVATINFGWESTEFYTRWMHGDGKCGREIADASLDPLNPQSEFAPALLRLFRQVLVTDEAYVARLRRHYEMFKRGQASGGAAAGDQSFVISPEIPAAVDNIVLPEHSVTPPARRG